MKPVLNRLLRRLVIVSVYALGVIGIVASGSSGGSGDDEDYACDLMVEKISPATDGSGDVWINVAINSNLISSSEPNEAVNKVVRLKSNGSEATDYFLSQDDFKVRAYVIAAAADNSGDVYVGGDVSSGIIRLNRDGTIDTGFATGSGFDGAVTEIAAATDGSAAVYVRGRFSNYDNTPVSTVVRLNSNGSLDGSFNPPAIVGGDYMALATDGSNMVYVDANTGDTDLFRLDVDGSQDGDITDLGNEQIEGVTTAADIDLGDIYIAWFDGTVSRYDDDGSLDAGFTSGSGFNGDADRISLESAEDGTGAIFVGSNFTTYNGTTAKGLARLNNDGSLDVNFMAGGGFDRGRFGDAWISDIERARDGTNDVYVGGFMNRYKGENVNGIARLNADGSLDADFDVRVDSELGTCNKQVNQ